MRDCASWASRLSQLPAAAIPPQPRPSSNPRGGQRSPASRVSQGVRTFGEKRGGGGTGRLPFRGGLPSLAEGYSHPKLSIGDSDSQWGSDEGSGPALGDRDTTTSSSPGAGATCCLRTCESSIGLPFWPSAQVAPSALDYQGGAQIYASPNILPTPPKVSPLSRWPPQSTLREAGVM